MTIRLILAAALMAGCADDPETLDSLFKRANEDGKCEQFAWGMTVGGQTFFATECSVACESDDKPIPEIPPGAVCPDWGNYGGHRVEFDGYVGTCGHVFGKATEVQWGPCLCPNPEDPENPTLPPCE
jgi:hypothetical protein